MTFWRGSAGDREERRGRSPRPSTNVGPARTVTPRSGSETPRRSSPTEPKRWLLRQDYRDPYQANGVVIVGDRVVVSGTGAAGVVLWEGKLPPR